MFNSTFFDKWLDKKSSELIENLDKRKLTSEEMVILVLKAQSNHFFHLDSEFREEMKKMREDFNSRFEQVDKRFEQMFSFSRWQLGLTFAMMSGILITLFI